MKRAVVVWTDRELSLRERKNYKKENPGKRLCFRLRFPDFPVVCSVITSILCFMVMIIMQLLK